MLVGPMLCLLLAAFQPPIETLPPPKEDRSPDVRWHLSRFPGPSQVKEAIAFNRAYRGHLAALLDMRPYEEWIREADQEAFRCWDAWDDLRLLQEGSMNPPDRLEALCRKIGPEAFWAGRMPMPVPAWRYALAE